MHSESLHRATVHFSGHVQGVGFRYTTLQVAKGFEVTGYVRNLSDGRVEMVAEGSMNEVAQFVSAVQERLEGFIRKVERRDDTGMRLHRGFGIQ